jgi:hypothetical protein
MANAMPAGPSDELQAVPKSGPCAVSLDLAMMMSGSGTQVPSEIATDSLELLNGKRR